MKAYEFESVNKGTIHVEITGHYTDGCVDISAWSDADALTMYRDFFDTDDADEVMVWLAEQGVIFESPRSAYFNKSYIQSVMIDRSAHDAAGIIAGMKAHPDLIGCLPDEVLAACDDGEDLPMMNRRINGKRYDTASAQLIGKIGGRKQFEALYRKQTGEYFAHISNERDGEKLVPLSYEDAERMADELDVDIAHFQPLGRAQVSTAVAPETARKLNAYCSKHGVTKRAVLERLIDGLED